MPHTVLHESIPLALAGNLLFPVCIEFPASPGIDMIYVGGNTMLLAEFKHTTYSPGHLFDEACFKLDANRHRTPKDVLASCFPKRNRVHERGTSKLLCRA